MKKSISLCFQELDPSHLNIVDFKAVADIELFKQEKKNGGGGGGVICSVTYFMVHVHVLFNSL